MNKKLQEIMLSVNPPYSVMIMDMEKKIEFRNKIICDLHKGDILWFYETKNKGGAGRIIGKATLIASIPLSAIYEAWDDCECFINNHKLFWNFCFDRGLEVPYAPTNAWVRDIRDKMQEEYSKYSNENDKEHLKKIGLNGSYALLFNDFIQSDLAMDDFVSSKTNNRLKSPPQNMFRVHKQIKMLKDE